MNPKVVAHQSAFMLKQRGALFSFYILLAIVLLNFTTNVFEFQGLDLVEMYHPAKMLSISYNQAYYSANTALLLIQLYPVLVVCPAGFILISEKSRKENLILISRVGRSSYYFNSLFSAFFVTFIVFTVPFFIELLLNCISFPLEATGDFFDRSQYDSVYISMTKSYFMAGLYNFNPYLYAIVGILFWGLFSGVLGMFTVAISAVFYIPYKVILFLPVFIALNATLYIPADLPFTLRWYNYVFLFDDSSKLNRLIICFMLILFVISFICVWFKSKADQL